MWEAEVARTLELFREKEAEHTWNAFNTDLSEWVERVGQSHDAPADAVVAALAQVLKPWTDSMESIRSALSATACSLVDAAAKRLGPAFDPLADEIVPHLLNLGGRSNRVFIRSAEGAMKAVAEHCQLVRLLPTFRPALVSKSVSRRQFVATAALGVFTGATNDGQRRRYADDIVELAIALLNDGDAKVRQTGKDLYAAVLAAWPDVAATIFGRLDSNRQAALRSLDRAERSDDKLAVGAAAAPKKAAAAPKPWRQPSAAGLAVIDANIAANAAGLDGVTVASKPPAAPAPAAPAAPAAPPQAQAQEQAQEQQAPPHAVGMPRRVHADPRQAAAATRSAGPPLLAALANRDAAAKAAAAVLEPPTDAVAPMEEVVPSLAPAAAAPASPVVQELEPLVQVLVTAPLPERKAALEALAELLRTHGLPYSETLGELLARQPPSVRLPLGRLLARRVPSEVLAPAIR